MGPGQLVFFDTQFASGGSMKIREFEVPGVGKVAVRVQEHSDFSSITTIPVGCRAGMTDSQAMTILEVLGTEFADRDLYAPMEMGQTNAMAKVRRSDGQVTDKQAGSLHGRYAVVYLWRVAA